MKNKNSIHKILTKTKKIKVTNNCVLIYFNFIIYNISKWNLTFFVSSNLYMINSTLNFATISALMYKIKEF